MSFRFLQNVLVGKIYIYLTSNWHSIFEGYASDISEELFEDLMDYKVVEISSGYDWRNDYDETESYIEITLEEN